MLAMLARKIIKNEALGLKSALPEQKNYVGVMPIIIAASQGFRDCAVCGYGNG